MLEPLLPDSPPTRLEEYVAETHKDALAASEERLRKSELNWLYYQNKQDQHLDKGNALSTFWGEPYPYRTENVLRGAVDTQVGRLVKDLPDVAAKPVTPDAFARNAAQKAGDLLEYWSFEYDLDREDGRVALWGFLSGHAGWKVVYDPDDEDPQSNGRVLFEAKKIWEVILDPDASEERHRKWVTFRRHVSVFEAHHIATERLNANLKPGEQPHKLDEAEIAECEYQPGVGREKRKGVEVQERWEIPHPQCPEGFYLLLVGGKVVEARPFPNMLPSRSAGPGKLEPYLPYVSWSPGESDSGPHGSTPVDDGTTRQRQHNETISRLAQLVRLAADQRLYGPEDILGKVKAGTSQYVDCPDPQSRPVWGEAPRISPALFAEEEKGPQAIRSLIGLDQDAHVTSNSDPAKKVAFVEQIDAYKLTGTYRSFTAMLEARAELALKTAQRFFTGTVNVTWAAREGDAVKELAFSGADLAGVTVRLEPRAGKEKFSETKGQAAAEAAANGLGDPQEAARAMQDGQTGSTFEAASRRVVALEIEEVRNGVQPMLEADPQIAIPTLRDAASVFEQAGDVGGKEAAEQLAVLYGEQLQANPPQAPQQPQQAKSVQAPTQKPGADVLPGGPTSILRS